MEMDSLQFLIGNKKSGAEEGDPDFMRKSSSVARAEKEELEIKIDEFKMNVEESLEIIENEIEEAYSAISDHCVEQIQANDTILTIGYSSTVLEFLKEAANQYSFTVIVVENSPHNSGATMAKKLTKQGINTILISDNSAFAYMSKVR